MARFWTVVCNETNNGFAEEMRGVVIADFRFEGVKKTYRVEFEPIKIPLEELRKNLFTQLETKLATYSDREVADSIQHLLVDSLGKTGGRGG